MLHDVPKNVDKDPNATRLQWDGQWTKSAICKGNGFIVEGRVIAKRSHSMAVKNANAPDALPNRFVALQVKISQPAQKRNFKPDGTEIAPHFQDQEKHIKGYLSFDHKQAQSLASISTQEFCNILGQNSGGPTPKGWVKADILNKLHPKQASVFEFWVDVSDFHNKDINIGSDVRLKTIGDSILVESITKIGQITSTLKNFSGSDSVGESWTSKIKKKDSESEEDEHHSGADSDEW